MEQKFVSGKDHGTGYMNWGNIKVSGAFYFNIGEKFWLKGLVKSTVKMF